MAKSALNISNIPPGVRESFKAACATVAAELKRPVFMEHVLIDCMKYLSDPDHLKNFMRSDNE